MVSVQVPLLVALPVALAALGAHGDSPNIAVGVVGFVHCLSQEAPTRVRPLLVFRVDTLSMCDVQALDVA